MEKLVPTITEPEMRLLIDMREKAFHGSIVHIRWDKKRNHLVGFHEVRHNPNDYRKD